ncbi:P44-88 outer membrane protein, partial [Anaplasma phagocytophilum str. HGE1]
KSIIREDETVYLLAKELAYDVVTGQTDKLTAALAKTSGKDIVQFANALGISHSGIDGKICKTKAQSGKKYGEYAEETEKSSSSYKTSLCGDDGGSEASTTNNAGQALGDFVAKTLKEGSNGNWPTSRKAKSGNTNGEDPKQNDNAKAVAKDLVKELTPEEKTIVAGLLEL